MKQKRTFVTLLLIVGILCLGIAYAAVTSQTLTISGSAGVATDDTPVNVVFTAADVQEGYDGTVTAEVSSPAMSATISVSDFKVKDDTATVVYTIQNQQKDLAVTLGTPIITLDDGSGKASGWFDVTCELGTNKLTKNNDTLDLNTAETTATVTVTLKETPVSVEPSDEITITIVATPDETSVQAGA